MIAYLILIGTIGVFRRMIPLSSAVLAFFRGLIGSFSVALYALLSKKKLGKRPDIRSFFFLLVSGFFIGINWILLFEAYNYTTISKATLAYYMQPTI
ncbi:MAG: EamA family transporter, partial [Oscillospiraceae bacterium]|nr:EamA family transporter [Oscillospiraceae bacterium]